MSKVYNMFYVPRSACRYAEHIYRAGLEIVVDTLAISGQIIIMSGQNEY